MIDMVNNKEQRDTAIETLEALDKAKLEGCLEATMLQMLAKAVPGLHNEHAFTSIEMYKALNVNNVGSVNLSAKTQSGKTGAIIAFCVLLYQQAELGNYKDKYKLWFTGPSDLALRDQTETRLFANAMIEVNTLGSKCWHAAEYYRKNGVEKKKLINQFDNALSTDHTIFIFVDESHIGIGTKQQQTALQNLPELFDGLAGIPGIKTNPRVKFVLISATPYTYDNFMKNNPDADMVDLWLPSGVNYSGLPDHLANGRIRQHIKRFTGQCDNEYKNDIQELMEQFDNDNSDNPGYFPMRVSGAKDRPLFVQAAAEAGLKCEVFISSEGNIRDFETILEEPPNENTILIIVRSYKQGKTLCKDYIRAWYEADTKSKNGRNDADVYQSVGRNDGYNITNLNYPIYMCMEQARSIVKYIEDREAGNSLPPMSSTHTKTKKGTVKVKDQIMGNDPMDAMKKYNLRTGKNLQTKEFNRIRLSHITEKGRDVIKEYKTQALRNTRPGKPNLVIFDKPNANSQKSWDSNPDLHGKTAVVWNTGATQEVMKVTRDTSMYNKK